MEEKFNQDQRNAERLVSTNERVEQLRIDGYEAAAGMLITKRKLNEREHKRLVAKYGKDHPKVTANAQQAVALSRQSRAVAAQYERAKNPAPNLAPGAWQIAGRVMNKDGAGCGDLSVSLFTTDGKWARELGYTCSDPSGYFALVVGDPEVVKRHEGVPFLLTATNDQQEIVGQSKEQIFLRPDVTMIRTLIVDKGKCAVPQREPTDGSGGTSYLPPNDKPVVVNLSTEVMVNPEEQPIDPNYIVWGFVKNAKGQPMAKVRVKAVANLPDGDCDLGKEAVTDERGRYKIAYTSADFGAEGKRDATADIVLSLYDDSGKKIFEDSSARNAPRVARVDVMVRHKFICW